MDDQLKDRRRVAARKWFARLQEAVTRDLLVSHPNPGRVGCPGIASLAALATGKLSPDGPVGEHITACSPCYQQFLQIQLRNRRRKWAAVGAVAVTVFGVSALLITTRHYIPQRPAYNSQSTHRTAAALAAPSPVLSLVLRPGLSRSLTASAGNQVLVLPPKPTLVRLLLHLEDDTVTLFDVVIQTVEGRELLRFAGLQKQLLPEHGSIVALDIQSAAIKPGAYVLLLFDHDPRDLKNVYNLQVAQ